MGASYPIVGSVVNGHDSGFEEIMPILVKLFGFVLILLALLSFGFYIFGVYDIP